MAPDWFLSALSEGRALPYPALHVMAGAILVALLARSLAALIVSGLLLGIAGYGLLLHPADENSWLIFWSACAGSLFATVVAWHRQRLARRVNFLAAQMVDLKAELADLRPKYDREIMWRRAAEESPREAGPAELVTVVPELGGKIPAEERSPDDPSAAAPAVMPKASEGPLGRFVESWRALPLSTTSSRRRRRTAERVV
jgi:hypothetical protein